MKKILGIIASPRNLGNSEMMVKEISSHIPLAHELNLLRLSDFNIRHCTGCYQCLFKKEGCVLDDDLHIIQNAILDADALIVAAPAYFLGANAALKLLLDRGLSFLNHVEKLWGKPAVGIAVAGIEGKEGSTLLGIESFLKLTMTEVKKTAIAYGALPGEVFFNEQNKKTAAELGESLFAPAPEKKAYACPLCGGDTFRFLGDNKVKCMLCSNSGTMRMESGSPVFEINKGEHELFLTKEETIQHGEWLQKMKGRFKEQKSRLKEISMAYKEGGNWIKP
ncbi:flavodoxin family protein [Desulfonema magnum]|uniref:NADPH-dependent FMN reductase n=1 Tax=Desulfonema magnum TaxID=45655 RepID=A0A975GPT1_9BACT|nr:flavodoxin family protein [Desulfonema magnum]QTA89336.1 NADPH-dependent FMN reductase [Desulfonema magnum]